MAVCGCKKEAKVPTPTQADAKPINVDVPVEAQEKQRIERGLAMRARVEPPAPALKLRGGELATSEVLEAYNMELARLVFREGDAPETFAELVGKKKLPKLPTPPPGKRIVYDARNYMIRLDPP